MQSLLYDCLDLRTANVYGIYGHLGGGKTLTAVDLMLAFLAHGHKVISNIQLLNISSPDFTYIDDMTTVDWWSLPQGSPRGSSGRLRSAIFIDETAEWFDQYSSTSPQVKSFLSWLRHSSKRGQFVFLIIQNKEFLAKSLRILINKWILCLDMYQLRLPVLKIRPPFCGDWVMRKVFDRYGNCLSRGFLLCNKQDIGYYYSTSQNLAIKNCEILKSAVVKPFPHRYKTIIFCFAYIYYIFLLW